MPQLAVALWLLAAADGRVAPEGRSWTAIGPMVGATPVAIGSVTFDPISRMLYGGGLVNPNAPTSARVFRRPASGGIWTEVTSPELDGLYPSVAVSTDSVGFVYASVVSCVIFPPLGCGGGLARSADAGEHWNRLRTGATSAVSADPFNASVMLAVESSQAPDPMFPSHVTTVQTALRSLDGGVTWTESETPPSPRSFAFDPTGVATVFAATLTDGVWKSVDSGATWTATGAGIDTPAFWVAVDDFGAIFVATETSVFVSRDGGDHWSAVGPALSGAIIADTVSGGAYVGAEGGVVHIDADGFAVPVGGAISNVISLATDGQRLWAGTFAGVFEFDLRDRHPRIAPGRAP